MTVEIAEIKGFWVGCTLTAALALSSCAQMADIREEQDTMADLERKGIPVIAPLSPIIIEGSSFGAVTPQGITYHPGRKTFFVASNGRHQEDTGQVIELSLDGLFLNRFSTSEYATEPEGISYDPRTDSLLIVDGDARISRVSVDGTLHQPSPMLDLGDAISRDVDGIAVHPDTGNLWITDDYYEKIYEIDRKGWLVQTVDTRSLVNGFWEPEGLEFLSSDRLLIADDRSGTSAIYEFSTDGRVLKMFDVSLNDFWDPEGVAFTGSRIAVVDGNGNRLLIAPYDI